MPVHFGTEPDFTACTKGADDQPVTLQVPSVTCEHCQSTISRWGRRRLRQIRGAHFITTRLKAWAHEAKGRRKR